MSVALTVLSAALASAGVALPALIAVEYAASIDS